MVEQLDLLAAIPKRDTAAILRLIAGDPLHQRDREAVVEAILDVADENDGAIDPNLVRPRIPAWVYPKVVGPTYSSLRAAKVISADGFVIYDDVKGGNAGRWVRRYRLVQRGEVAA